ncbi:FAS1 domain-containing protein [Paraphoma chrysanthemicola]|uniref:FAS1 domain-containing protein n=1 Tax=Paraphoma chrysanthemicola TaxID=798071 RepID=A0A8K0RH24_9PLEO|nr:FAS1 domain-containing protein [Paraphoma chrysanthemicola]
MRFQTSLSVALLATAASAASLAETFKALNLTSLPAALDAANLTATIAGLKGITIFAPDDVAFTHITKDLTPEQVVQTLKLHVIPKVRLVKSFGDDEVIKTLGGEVRTTLRSMGRIYVNDANITRRDVTFDNGVVQVINKLVSTMQNAFEKSLIANLGSLKQRTPGLESNPPHNRQS